MSIEFNLQFQKALDLLENSESHLFITGNAGTGKSTLLSYFVAHTRKKVAVLAPTGVAALNVRGETLHSFFRFHSGITVEEAKKRGHKVKNDALYREIELIVIDEISMVRADLLDCVDVFLRAVLKKNSVPFGGVRMVFIGDLYQLPPVMKGEAKKYFSVVYNSPYFFSAKVMEKADFSFLELEKIYRQNDPVFIEKLNAIRKNRTEEALAYFNQRVSLYPENDAGFIYLTATNRAAERINLDKLEKLPGSVSAFRAETEGNFDESMAPTDPNLLLKKGAQVMFLANHTQGLWVNGTLGVVKTISNEGIFVEIYSGGSVWVERHDWELCRYVFSEKTRTLEKEKVGSFLQFPLRLAWAITVHKSQGKSFDKVIIDLGAGFFAHGQAYVALSRCRSVEDMILKSPLKKGHVLTDYRVPNFLTGRQYEIAQKSFSNEQKIEIIGNAIKEGRTLEIVYLKSSDEKSFRAIKPVYMGPMEYKKTRYHGVEAFCLMRQEKRVFRIDRILEIK